MEFSQGTSDAFLLSFVFIIEERGISHITENKLVGTRSTYGINMACTVFYSENLTERNRWLCVRVDGKMTLKLIFKKMCLYGRDSE
jgi:hypothetical protein